MVFSTAWFEECYLLSERCIFLTFYLQESTFGNFILNEMVTTSNSQVHPIPIQFELVIWN